MTIYLCEECGEQTVKEEGLVCSQCKDWELGNWDRRADDDLFMDLSEFAEMLCDDPPCCA